MYWNCAWYMVFEGPVDKSTCAFTGTSSDQHTHASIPGEAFGIDTGPVGPIAIGSAGPNALDDITMGISEARRHQRAAIATLFHRGVALPEVVCVKFSKKILGMWAQVKLRARSGALSESSATRPQRLRQLAAA